MAENLPNDGNTSGVFCIYTGCDANLSNLNENTKNMNYKRTFDQSNAGAAGGSYGGHSQNFGG